MTTFLLIRHGATEWVGRALAGRRPDIHLNERGRREALALSDQLEPPVHALYSSPLERARETAEPIARRFRLPVEIRYGLHEVDFGDWTGRRLCDLDGCVEWQQFNAVRSAATIPGGESMAALRTRVATEIADLSVLHPGQRVAVVTHGDIIRTALLHFTGRSFDEMPTLDVETGSVHLLALEPARATEVGVVVTR